MKSDYIFYLACFVFGVEFLGIFRTEKADVIIPKEIRGALRFLIFLVITTPIYGRIFGWW